MAEPIAARIVVETGGIRGGPSKDADPDNKIKSVSKLLRSILGVQKDLLTQSAGGLLKKLLGAGAMREVLKAAGVTSLTAAGGLTAAAGLAGIGVGGAMAQEDGTGATLEQQQAIADELGITLEELQEQSKLKQTITKDTRTEGEKIEENNKLISDQIASNILTSYWAEKCSTAMSDYEKAIRTAAAKISGRTGGYILGDGSFTDDYTVATQDAANGGQGMSIWIDPNKPVIPPFEDFAKQLNAASEFDKP